MLRAPLYLGPPLETTISVSGLAQGRVVPDPQPDLGGLRAVVGDLAGEQYGRPGVPLVVLGAAGEMASDYNALPSSPPYGFQQLGYAP